MSKDTIIMGRGEPHTKKIRNSCHSTCDLMEEAHYLCPIAGWQESGLKTRFCRSDQFCSPETTRTFGHKHAS